jgi:hypothetical protein
MVLQCKVFLAVMLQQYSPFISKKRTFFRRMKAAIDKSLKSGMMHRRSESPSPSVPRPVNLSRSTTPDDLELQGSFHGSGLGRGASAAKPLEIGNFFTKLPFPEPRRGISLRPRDDLDLLPSV